MNTSSTNHRLVTILLILLIILVAVLVIGIVAGFFMMGSRMRGGMMMNPMMGGDNNYANVKPLTIEQVKAAAENYLTNLKNSDLKINEVMIFNNNAYVIVKETSTGNGAFELLVDPASHVAYPEYGPNMMWNLKYGCLNMNEMMGGNNNTMGEGMMGNCDGNNATPPNVSAEMTVNREQAIEFAQKYLDANIPGTKEAKLGDKETRDTLNWLMDYHDRIKATRNSALDLRAILSFVNSLLLPLIAFVLANLETIKALFP